MHGYICVVARIPFCTLGLSQKFFQQHGGRGLAFMVVAELLRLLG